MKNNETSRIDDKTCQQCFGFAACVSRSHNKPLPEKIAASLEKRPLLRGYLKHYTYIKTVTAVRRGQILF